MQSSKHTASQWIAFGVLLCASMILVTVVFLPLWQPLFLGVVLAGALQKLHDRLAHRLREKRAWSAMIFTVGLVVLVLLPLTAMTTIAVREIVAGANFVNATVRASGIEGLTGYLPQTAAQWVHRLIDLLPSQAGNLSEKVAGALAIALGGVMSAASDVAFNAAIMLVAFYCLLVDGRRFVRWLQRISPLGEGRTHELLREFRQVSGAVLSSTVATATVQAAAALIGYLIARVPHPFFFGLLTWFSAFIPSVGTAVVAIPLSGLVFLLGHKWAALFLLLYSVLVVGSIDNLVKPLLIKDDVQMHGGVVFLSLIGGVVVFGAMGLLVGPLAVSFLLAMIRLGSTEFRFRSPQHDESLHTEPPTHACGAGDVGEGSS